MIFIVLSFIFLFAFFPAHFGYNSELQRVWLLTTMIFWLSSYIPFVRDFGKKWIAWILALGVFAYVIESIGVLTCVPYGCFVYSNQLWPKLLNLVPRVLLFTRPPLVIGVWSLIRFGATRAIRVKQPAFCRWKWNGLLWIEGWLFLVLADLVLDPAAVIMGLRSYFDWGFWFGVPWTNFVGRLLTGATGIMILDLTIWTLSNEDDLMKKSQDYAMGLWLFLSFFLGYLFFSLSSFW